MLPFCMFACTACPGPVGELRSVCTVYPACPEPLGELRGDPRSSIPTESESAKLQSGRSPDLSLRPRARSSLTLPTRSLRSFTKECLGTPLQTTRCAFFFKAAGCMAICKQFFELKLLEDSRPPWQESRAAYTALRERKKKAQIARFCATTPLLATLAHFKGGGYQPTK